MSAPQDLARELEIARETIRAREREIFELEVALDLERNTVKALEDVVRATAKIREQT